ncbi:MAG: hypothetical protein OEW42_17900 [Acidimicrobiia bacterium]|nr:hypothetical protein [Acidimicrobiia bacterium]
MSGTDPGTGRDSGAEGLAGPSGRAEDEIVGKVRSGEAWREFCALLEQAGEVILADRHPDGALDRAEGFRMLTRLLRGALESNLEWADPDRPALICTCHETIKIVAENPDNLYLGARISGDRDYRLSGTRGEARWLSLNTFGGGGFGGGGRGTGTTLHEHEIEVAEDGAFEVVLSADDPGPGVNWLRLEPDSRSLTIRQTFVDKANQVPAALSLERIERGVAVTMGPPGPLDPRHLYRALLTAGHYVAAVAGIGADWAARQAEHPNVFADVQEDDTRAFKDPQITWHQAYFDLGADEALVIEFTPPECEYWMIGLHNHWMETLDYRYHQVALNGGTAEVGADGFVRCVVAGRDPGVPNWLDTAGHVVGTVGVRWVGDSVPESGAPGDVVPTTRVMAVAEIGAL